jgi:hypothetical protein
MSKHSQADPQVTKRTREHFAWQEHVAARRDLSSVFRLVAWALALFRSVETGRCDPSYGGLAKRAGVSEITAKRAIAELESLKLIAVKRTAGGSSASRNSYRFLFEGVSDQSKGYPTRYPKG